MEGIPEYLDYSEILETFLQIDGVVRVHNLRIWVRYIFIISNNYYFQKNINFFLWLGIERQQSGTSCAPRSRLVSNRIKDN